MILNGGWLNSLDDASWLVDASTLRVQAANAPAVQLMHSTAEALAGSDASSLLPTLEDLAFWSDVRAGRHGRLESICALQFADGQQRRMQRRIVPLQEAQGEPGSCGVADSEALPALYLVQLRDCTVAYESERERQVLLAELRGTLEATSDAVLVVDVAGCIQAFNRRFAELWGLPPAALVTRDDEAIYRWMRMATLRPDEYQRRLEQIQEQLLLECSDAIALSNGAWIERHTEPQWSEGRPIGRVYCFRETNRHRPGAPRTEAAQGDDECTRLPNRTGFLQQVEDAMRGAHVGNGALAVLCIEFDSQALFGLASQESGSSNVRRMSELADRLRACMRAPQRIARIGAARFAVLMRGAGEEAAESVARRLLDALRPGGPAAPTTADLPVCIGIATYPDSGLGAADLLCHAEAALSAAQLDGKSTWCVHRAGPRIDASRQQRLEHDVRRGLTDHAFRLRLQPRLDPRNGRLHAMEVALRWRDQARGDVAPMQFQQLAQQAGLEGALDDWLLERALRAATLWRRRHEGLVVAVAVSGWQLVQPGYARRVAAVLQAASWPATQVELEVTEDALNADEEAARTALAALEQLGVRVVLDGYGHAGGSFGALERYALAAVKLDRALLRPAERRAGAAQKLAALMAYARAHNLMVYAQGVESAVQVTWLADAGCHGYTGLQPVRRTAAAPAPAVARAHDEQIDEAAEPADALALAQG